MKREPLQGQDVAPPSKEALRANSVAPEPKRRKSVLSEELTLFSQALQSFAEMLKSKRPTFSHKQMKYLNGQLSTTHWRISWNRRQQWALVPRSVNPLWGSLLAPLPQGAGARRKAIEKRREALKFLASNINSIVRHCEILPKRQRNYVTEPRANKLVREILQVVNESPVMDKSSDRLPRAKAFYSENFEDKPAYVQEIIKTRQKQKYEKKMKKSSEDFKRESPNFF